MPEQPALNNARTSFQRLTDARFFHGWVKKISPRLITVHVLTDVPFAAGEDLAFQVFGSDYDAFLEAEIAHITAADLDLPFHKKPKEGTWVEIECRITTDVSLKATTALPRFLVAGFVAHVPASEFNQSATATILDIGPQGFSFVSDGPYRKGEKIEVTIRARGQTMKCEVEVRNCNQYGPSSDQYRVGLQITGMSRIDACNWQDVYASILEVNRVPGLFVPIHKARVQRVQKPAA